MRAVRRHVVVRLFACLLLTWAAADLLVPQLCSAETATQDSGSPLGSQDHDDCFCCCTHAENPVPVTVAFANGAPVLVRTFVAEDLAVGIPRSLYHPPLHA